MKRSGGNLTALFLVLSFLVAAAWARSYLFVTQYHAVRVGPAPAGRYMSGRSRGAARDRVAAGLVGRNPVLVRTGVGAAARRLAVAPRRAPGRRATLATAGAHSSVPCLSRLRSQRDSRGRSSSHRAVRRA